MSENQSQPSSSSNSSTIIFIVVLSFVCALVLSILASALREPQQVARALDRSVQMMMSARIVNPNGYFQVQNEKGEYVPAKFVAGGVLEATDSIVYPDGDELFQIYKKRLIPKVVNKEGKVESFQQAGLNEQQYINSNQKKGYYSLPEMLVYEILPNQKSETDAKPIGYVIPVNGYGLWDAIYGYLAIEPNGDTVIGVAWYDQKETPGLGAVISEAAWQNQFHGKLLFEPSPDGETDFKTAPLGITVVRGEVKNVIGDKPKAKTAVDGIPGATLTGNGVTNAFRDVLAPYRPFLIKLHEENSKK